MTDLFDINQYRAECADVIKRQCEKYPDLQAEDIFKALYQCAYGCEHLLTDKNEAIYRIKDEYSTAKSGNEDYIEALAGGYSRLFLDVIRKGLSAETFGKIFSMSAIREEAGGMKLQQSLDVFTQMAVHGEVPFNEEELKAQIEAWRKRVFCPCRHSVVFREKYAPAYRVVSNRFIRILPILISIDRLLAKGNVTIAVDGPCGSGKTTLAAMLKEIYDCEVYHTDDFLLPFERRTEDVMAVPGWNFDRERFVEQVLHPLKKGENVQYARFDCSVGKVVDPVEKKFSPLSVIEGVCSMHEDIANPYDLRIYIDIAPELQRERILKRNSPETALKFFEKWIPDEEKYFAAMHVKERSDIIISAE